MNWRQFDAWSEQNKLLSALLFGAPIGFLVWLTIQLGVGYFVALVVIVVAVTVWHYRAIGSS